MNGNDHAINPARPAPSFNKTVPARILVVDDQPTNIQIIGSVLGKSGHEIIPATDGPTALKRIALRPPDLILLDMLMPGMSGYDVCAQVMANPAWKDIPVIFLSAADDKDFIVRALDAGAVDFITKPFNQAELLSRVRTQLALKTARDQLKQLAEDKDELIGVLAHDLKNYLGGIHMSAELLRGYAQKYYQERPALLTENIFRSSGLALSFVKEFLANAAADHGLELKPVALNLADAVAAVIEQHQESAGRKQLTMHADFPAAIVTVRADALALDQVLDNLVCNAIKFSPAGKEIFITVRAVENHGVCVIRDEGPGFTAEDKTRMFRRYSRLSARPTGGEASTGLGLSIVRKLVQDMHGELFCDSVHGSGATFTIRLPYFPATI